MPAVKTTRGHAYIGRSARGSVGYVFSTVCRAIVSLGRILIACASNTTVMWADPLNIPLLAAVASALIFVSTLSVDRSSAKIPVSKRAGERQNPTNGKIVVAFAFKTLRLLCVAGLLALTARQTITKSLTEEGEASWLAARLMVAYASESNTMQYLTNASNRHIFLF